jgi:hypothetical protein
MTRLVRRLTVSEILVQPTDRQRLAAFVLTVTSDLDFALDMRGRLFALAVGDDAREELLASMYDAWQDARLSVGSLIERILSGEHEIELTSAGLTGPQLTFKLVAWAQARDTLTEAVTDSPEPEVEPPAHLPPDVPPSAPAPATPLPKKPPKWLRWVLKKLNQTLYHADTILESLASVIKIAEPLKEIKKTIEKVAEDTSESLPEGPI